MSLQALIRDIHSPNSRDTRPLYRKVESYIESLVHSGGLKPGEMIPSHSQLAKTLGVNNLTVKRAIRELVFKRVLVSLQGRGTFVAEGSVKRVLWVTEIDLFGGDTSAYYGDLFRHALTACEANGLRLEPVWLAKDRPYDVVLNANGGDAAILGYLFSACDQEHELLRYVSDAGKPFVNLSMSHWNKPRSVLPNEEQAFDLVQQFFHERQFRRISIFGLSQTYLNRIVPPGTLKADFITQPPASGQAELERNSYQITRHLLAKGELSRAVYIVDDIIARGVTRALLQLPASEREAYSLLIQSSLQEMIPYGFPVNHIVFDVAEQAQMAVNLLLAQIQGREETLQHQCDYRILSEEELARLPGMGSAEESVPPFEIL